MKSNLIGAITERMPTLSKGQKRIARFILEHYDSAAFMTANKLGREVQVSESTVVRFATNWAMTVIPVCRRPCRSWSAAS